MPALIKPMTVTKHARLSRLCRACHTAIMRGQRYYVLGHQRGIVHEEHYDPERLPMPFTEEIFGTEDLLSTQAYASAPWTPCQRLFLAILWDGVHCALTYEHWTTRRAQNIAAEAWRWIHSPEDQYLGSFINCCHAIGVDPDYLRHGLDRARQDQKRFTIRLASSVDER